MSTLLWAVLIVIVLIIIYLFATSYVISQQVIHPNTRSVEYINKRHEEDNTYKPEHFDGIKKENIDITSDFGYKIRAFIACHPKPTQNVIVISHGVTMRSEFSYRYFKILLNMGYNVLFLDSRGHGETGVGKDIVSYGYYEKHDLAKVVNWAKDNFTGKIGLHGESMGAGITMQAVELVDVDFIIDDCGYSSFDEEVRHQIRTTPYVFNFISYPLARLFIKIRGKFDIEDVSPVKALAKFNSPILIVHGSIDNYVPYYMADIIMKSIPHDKKHLYAPEAKHACSVKHDPAEYEKQVKKFLKKYDLYFGE